MTKRKYEPKERRKEFLRKTDTEKFANLIMMYQDDMYYLALSICKNEADAQDIVGETIVKAFEARNQLRNDARFKYWIMKILTNTAYTYLKRKKRLVFEEPVEEIAAKNENPDHGLWAKVMEIEEKYRMVIILYYEQEFSTREISKILNIPEGTVRSRLARAREKLKDILSKILVNNCLIEMDAELVQFFLLRYLDKIYTPMLKHKNVILIFQNLEYASSQIQNFLLKFLKQFYDRNILLLLEIRDEHIVLQEFLSKCQSEIKIIGTTKLQNLSKIDTKIYIKKNMENY